MYLNCKTFFSYRYGTYDTKVLVKDAATAGITTMALTNINNTADTWDFVDFCRQAGIRPVAGTEIRNEDTLLYLLLARNNKGMYAINQFLSHYLQADEAFPPRPFLPEEVWIIYPLETIHPRSLKANELIGVQPRQINRLHYYDTAQYPAKFVVQQPVTFKNKAYYNAHRLLRAIDKNILLSKQLSDCPGSLADASETMVPPAELLQHFQEYPGIVANTLQVMDSCSIDMDFYQDKTKRCYTSSRQEDLELLEKLAIEGMAYRYGKNNAQAKERIQKELKIIDDLKFSAYFLIAWDVVQFARHKGFYYVGRGSGANSIIAYCLQITDVDPIELDLYFERFLNPHRSSPPDFDLDFSWRDRDEVISYVFEKYGREHVCLLGMISTFQHNALVREIGKVFGLPKGELDNLLSNPYTAFDEDSSQKLILQYSELMTDFPNHLSIHPGGILISEAPVFQYTGVDLPPKGFATSQIDMFVAEKIGLTKLDVLSQRGLGHIKDTIQLVKENKGVAIDIHDVERFKKDRNLAGKIKQADSIGCFYIESPAMRQLLQKLECDDYITLVAASSIIRPGVAQSGMMRQYVIRYHDQEKVEYLHPKMEELLKETYGVMVYQEDVIKVAHHFAGLEMGEADILRRAMSGKYRGKDEMLRIEQNFFGNCAERGYPEAVSKEVWRQIASFAGYSFSKAHSASFAVESYQSLYLKTYYPMEFMVGVINNFGGFYSTELYFYELQRTGARIHPPCVNNSAQLTTIRDKDVYVGFIHIQGLEDSLILRIENERNHYGSFLSLYDFIERTGIGMEQLNILIRVGALRFTGKNKKELLWEANFLHKRSPQKIPAAAGALFEETPDTFVLPTLYQHPLDDAMDELELLGFSLCNPFVCLDDDVHRYPAATVMTGNAGKEITLMGYLVTLKHIRTLRGERMFFGTFLDAWGNWLDTVHFPESAFKYPLQGRGFYKVTGIIMEEFGTYSLNVHFMEKAGIKSRKPAAKRDAHPGA
jgi:DNA-directed DNA polymerase III PolC